MPRSGVDMNKIVMLAAAITDEKGIEAVTLKEIGRQLNVSSPSLYNHIKGLPELKECVSHYAMKQLKECLVRAVTGHSGIEALKEMGRAYIQFAREHTGLYETIQWINIAADGQGESLFAEVVKQVYDIAAGFGADETEASHIIRTVRSLAHGFASVESHQGFSHSSSVESSYEYAIESFFAGVKMRTAKD